MGGQQATLYNSPIHFNLDTSGAAALRKDNFARNPRQFAGIYPIDSNGGVAVNNWSFSTVKNTSTYQNLVTQIQANNTSNAHRQIQREQLIFELFTKPYDEFFDTEGQAQEVSAPPANYTLNAYSSGVNAADVQGTPAGGKLTGLTQNYIYIYYTCFGR